MTGLFSPYVLSDFFYNLPSDLIADYPQLRRTDSRLLCLNKETGAIEHKRFNDILDFISPGDLLVLNDTKVIPARLFAHKPTGGKVEILVERILNQACILAHLKSNKSLNLGLHLHLENGLRLEIKGRLGKLFKLQFLEAVPSILDLLMTIGHMPLPPYIRRTDEVFDKERYQTIFARCPGAIAAPTAGLHFDEFLLESLQAKGVDITFITLHVGSGTFQPIRTERLEEHQMHAEYVSVSSSVCEKIQETKKKQKRVIAVGTTSVRSLETAAKHGFILPFEGETQLFIYPGFRFNCVDALLTNFHLPQSTLLILVCAFAGYTSVMEAYQQAINNKYRFFSYGDAFWVG